MKTEKTAPLARRVYTVREVSLLINKPEATVYRLAALGRIPCVRIGRSILFPKNLIDRILDGAAEVVSAES
jgi:excisionase family DNA binding protein